MYWTLCAVSETLDGWTTERLDDEDEDWDEDEVVKRWVSRV